MRENTLLRFDPAFILLIHGHHSIQNSTRTRHRCTFTNPPPPPLDSSLLENSSFDCPWLAGFCLEQFLFRNRVRGWARALKQGNRPLLNSYETLLSYVFEMHSI
ncbi:hypothetical protein CEXT_188081 [Caerostris extrusa]|uniref:Uncharacterized protein n=1 Tax=Caerostris extrusa TaxID=172846 RepID=A0AAV4QVZ6_CAEEX|nr:hypothetical protein CEXT_188081 [Caerostris extrusa]